MNARFLNSQNIYAAHSLTHTNREKETHFESISFSALWQLFPLRPPPPSVSRALTNEHYL